MKPRLREWDGGAPDELARALRRRPTAGSGTVAEAVATTLRRVREEGDAAVRELTARYDGVEVASPRVPREQLDDALRKLDPELRSALELAAANVRAVARAQLPGEPRSVELAQGQRVEVAEVPVRAAGIYVPGGQAPYPSTVLMGVIPARMAGVGRVVVCSPPTESGAPDETALAAAALADADEVLAIGGAQAIGALALGTESIAAVDAIAGPGNHYVQEAKLQVSARVGIDGYAGPSELVVVAGEGGDPEIVALDLAAQAEHGEDGLLVAICADRVLARAIQERLAAIGKGRRTVSDAEVDVVRAPGPVEALALAEALAPEHLQLSLEGAEDFADGVTTAGCVFCGPAAATAFGDYVAGSNHILPTGGAGRFTGPLGPASFMRRISRVRIDAEAAAQLAQPTDAIARAEGFPVHGESARARAEAAGQAGIEAPSGKG